MVGIVVCVFMQTTSFMQLSSIVRIEYSGVKHMEHHMLHPDIAQRI